MKSIYHIINIFGVLLLFSSSALCQQIPVLNQFVQNPYLYNPSYAGASEFGSLYMNYKRQWSYVPDAPTTQVITYDTPFSKDKIGLGATVFLDQAFVIKRFGGALSYAYHFKIGEHSKLSGGLSMGFASQRIDFSELPAETTEDQALLTENANQTTFDYAAGLNYQYKGLKIGFSIPQFGLTRMNYNDNLGKEVSFRPVNHYMGNISYEVLFGKDFFLTPNLLLRASHDLPVQLDFNLHGGWKEKIWLGVGTRTGVSGDRTFTAVNATFGVKIKKRISASYNYELATKYSADMGHTHELLLGFHFGQKIKKLNQELELLRAEMTEKTTSHESEMEAMDKVIDSLKVYTNDLNIKTDLLKEAKEKLEGDIGTLEKSLGIQRALEQQNNFEIRYLEYLLHNDRYKAFKDAELSYGMLGSIYFVNDEYRLVNESKVKIRQVADIINNQNFVFKVFVVGHASQVGRENYNQVLSTKRVLAVKDYLTSIGIPEDIILVIPMGEQNPVTNTKEVYNDPAIDRRVDIHIISDDMKPLEIDQIDLPRD